MQVAAGGNVPTLGMETVPAGPALAIDQCGWAICRLQTACH